MQHHFNFSSFNGCDIIMNEISNMIPFTFNKKLLTSDTLVGTLEGIGRIDLEIRNPHGSIGQYYLT